MAEYVYRPSRVKKGKKARAPFYRGRFKVFGKGELFDVALKTKDQQVAKQRLRQMVSEREREATGLLPARALRNASQKPVGQHLIDYIADLHTRGRSWDYVRHVESRVKELASACGWKRLADIKADTFEAWRTGKRASAKTLNEYLNAACAFMRWLADHERVEANPLERVVKVEARGRETYQRRALSVDECKRLLEAAGPRRLLYLVALTTGLRRGEIAALRWADVNIDEAHPWLKVRASTAKNHKEATIPLRPELAAKLRGVRPSGECNGDLVFPKGVPRNRDLRRDFVQAGIALTDDARGKVDFHALRHTFCTMLQVSGVSPRLAMEAMRHSDMRLTTKVYTDAKALPIRGAVMSLPDLVTDSLQDSLPNSLLPDTRGVGVSSTDAHSADGILEKSLPVNEIDVPSHAPSLGVAERELVEAGGIEPPSA